MRRMLVAVFDTRERALAARGALLAEGVHDTQIGMEGGGADAGGLAGVIARIFGAESSADATLAASVEALQGGATLLAVNALDDADIARVTSTLMRFGARRVDPYPDGRAGTHRGPRSADPAARNELAAVSSVGGPQVYALPNAPVGWNGTSPTAELRARTEDPARPKGEIEDAIGLDPEADRESLHDRATQRR